MEPEGGSKLEKTCGRRSGRPWPENGPKRRRRLYVMTVMMEASSAVVQARECQSIQTLEKGVSRCRD
jgi:hypothetical protein